MSTIVMIIASSEFRDEELFETRQTLLNEGHRVVIASRAKGCCSGNQGGYAQAELAFGDIDSNLFDALVFVGGGGAAEYFEDKEVFSLIERFERERKIIGAICIAPVILAGSGLLKGKRSTVFPSGKDRIIAHGAIYTAQPVTIDGRVVTADGPDSSVAFGKAISSLLKAMQ